MPAETIVTIRMPASLLAALRSRTAEDHYSDLSEQVRSIIRRGCLRYAKVVTHDLKELKGQLKLELLRETDDARAKEILEKLEALLGGGPR